MKQKVIPRPSLERILELAPEPDHFSGIEAEAMDAYAVLERIELKVQGLRKELPADLQSLLGELAIDADKMWEMLADLHLSSISLNDDLVAWGRDWRQLAEPSLPVTVRVRYAVEKANADSG